METNAILPKELSTRKISDFVQQVLRDLSASERIKMSYLGIQLGLYNAMAFAGPLTVGELARRASSNVRLVKRWLQLLASDGYITHEPESDTYTLPAEHAIALTDTASPFYIGDKFRSVASEKPGRLRTGRELADEVQVQPISTPIGFTDASARFFSSEYVSSLFNRWLPGVEDLTRRLEQGIAVADLGCGRHGASTLIMAEAFPASTFYGFDRYESSVERANLLAKEKRLGNVHFELATAELVQSRKYDLITMIECLRHMGNLQDLLYECYEILKPDGILVVVEAKDRKRIGEELYQRLRAGHGRQLVAEEVMRVELGVDANEKELQHDAREAGFSLFRKVTETVYDTVYEMRP